MKTWLIIVQLIFMSTFAASSNILMVLPLGSRSHKNIFTPLAEKLVNNGHSVTLASLHGSTKANGTLPYSDVVASKAWEVIRRVTGEFNVFKMLQNNDGKNINSEVMKKVIKHMPEYCDAFLRDPDIQVIWNSRPDLILLPAFMNECGLIFVQKFKVPFIYVTTSGLTPWTADLVGNPEHPAYVPNQYLPYTDEMNLWQRTVNSIARLLTPALRRHFVLGRLDNVAQKFLKDPSVSLQEIEKGVSLIFVNSHHSLGFPRPLQPNVIEIGGMHCREATPIAEQDLKEYLDSSDDGSVILFSLGSHIKSSEMPNSLKSLFIRAFARLPYKVVWKWEGAPFEGLPSNVILRKWLPQQDVLGHRAVGAFFTHGGLLSTQEAIYHGVPMVGLPLMSDQHLNVKQAEAAGIAVSLKLETLTENDVVKALTTVIEDKSYRQLIKERSLVMKDQETKPLDRATYYTEYVLRHNGARHLRSTAASLTLMQYFLGDVILVTAAVVVIFLSVTIAVVVVLYKGLNRIRKIITKKVVSSLRSHMMHAKHH